VSPPPCTLNGTSPAPATTRPTGEFLRRHDVEAPRVDATAFRQGWRMHTRLDALFVDRRITAAEWQATIEYRTTYERIRPSHHVLAGRGARERWWW
jgi:hypothetical protein